jgi:molybdopterin-guanine dinucleotide biosynthesis protein A
MADLLDAVRTRYLEEGDLPGLDGSRSFANLNTPEDLAAAGRS